MHEINDVSKAVAETAKLGIKALDFSEEFGSFLSNVFGGSAEAAAGIMEDKLVFMQWERRIRMVDKVNEYWEFKGLEKFRPIPPKFAIPMIENATLEEDDDLQDIWCRLIVNNLDSNFDFEMRYAFIEIIKNLTSLDAKILEFIYKSSLEHYPHDDDIPFRDNVTKNYYSVPIHKISNQFNLLDDNINVSIDNLLRVRCLKDNYVQDSMGIIGRGAPLPSARYSLTQLGINFVESCIKL